MQDLRPENDLTHWTPPPRPQNDLVLDGRYVLLERLNAEQHAALLFRAFDGHPEVWDFLPVGPFTSAAQFHRWVRDLADGEDPCAMAVFNKDSGAFEGTLSFLRVAPEMGCIELGYIAFCPALQRTRAATEAMVLMMGWAFEVGYRRFEWKCDARNIPSRRAAERFGLSFEGVFRQHMVVKGRNRDTAWFAATDVDWPALQEAFSAWLSPANFDANGAQRERLSDLTCLVRTSSDPIWASDGVAS